MSYHLTDLSTASESSSDSLFFIRHHFSNLSLHNVPLLLLLLCLFFLSISMYKSQCNSQTKCTLCIVFDAQLLSKSILSAVYNCKMCDGVCILQRANNVEAGVKRHRTKKKWEEEWTVKRYCRTQQTKAVSAGMVNGYVSVGMGMRMGRIDGSSTVKPILAMSIISVYSILCNSVSGVRAPTTIICIQRINH